MTLCPFAGLQRMVQPIHLSSISSPDERDTTALGTLANNNAARLGVGAGRKGHQTPAVGLRFECMHALRGSFSARTGMRNLHFLQTAFGL